MDFLPGKKRIVGLQSMNRAQATETAFWKLVTAVQRLAVWTGYGAPKAGKQMVLV